MLPVLRIRNTEPANFSSHLILWVHIRARDHRRRRCTNAHFSLLLSPTSRTSEKRTRAFINWLTVPWLGLAFEPDSYAVARHVKALSGSFGNQLDLHATIVLKTSGRVPGRQPP